MADLDRRALLAGAALSTAGVPAASSERSQGAAFFPGLKVLDVDAGGVRFAGAVGGSGPPLLLLHGWPETHIAWRKVAPALARRHTLVIPDLPGYGTSRPHARNPRWTKRRVGVALVALMHALGHERFALAGHDRGARAGYRLVLDHPGRVTRFASLAVIPTLDAMAAVDYRYATKAYHWFFLAQEADLPERMLAAAPDLALDRALAAMMASEDEVIEPAARRAYHLAFGEPVVRHMMCEDYRAGLREDLAADEADRAAGRKLDCPVLFVGSAGETRAGAPTPADVWRLWAADVTAAATTGDHLQMEDRPQQVLEALLPFLDGR